MAQPQPSQENPKITKLPAHLRLIEEHNQKSGNTKIGAYDPMVVSLGPYNHGKPELQAGEDFKTKVLNKYLSESKITSLPETIHAIIDEIRDCYEDKTCSVDNYNDEELTMMILRDACLIVAFVERVGDEREAPFLDWQQCTGAAALRFAIRDLILFENQIPFHVVKMILMQEKEQNEDKVDQLLYKFVNWMMCGETSCGDGSVPDQEMIKVLFREHPPLHLLEACRRMLVAVGRACGSDTNNNNNSNNKDVTNVIVPVWKFIKPQPSLSTRHSSYASSATSYRSVIDLKAKGIHCIRASSSSYEAVQFKSGKFFGELRLPGRVASSNTLVFLSNMIAFEVSSGASTEFEVLSYVNFMKSLIQTAADAKELQEKGILFNRFHNHEQVVQLFKQVNTFGIDNVDIFRDVKRDMENHCRNKTKTWLADLIHTRFSTPWTVIGLLAAIFLLCLTFVQTYFTIHPTS